MPSSNVDVLKPHLFEDIVRIFKSVPLIIDDVKFSPVQGDCVRPLINKVCHLIFDVEWYICIPWIIWDDGEYAIIHDLLLQLNNIES